MDITTPVGFLNTQSFEQMVSRKSSKRIQNNLSKFSQKQVSPSKMQQRSRKDTTRAVIIKKMDSIEESKDSDNQENEKYNSKNLSKRLLISSSSGDSIEISKNSVSKGTEDRLKIKRLKIPLPEGTTRKNSDKIDTFHAKSKSSH